ncbi:hypothetical protein [Amycolatopsis sp. NPDC004079]|uniref:hypothetical protein n=1 Tax=Amycolatopsis sp. NPDC004079 TaxID=3154549 RepID=UPI0033B92A1C
MPDHKSRRALIAKLMAARRLPDHLRLHNAGFADLEIMCLRHTGLHLCRISPSISDSGLLAAVDEFARDHAHADAASRG